MSETALLDLKLDYVFKKILGDPYPKDLNGIDSIVFIELMIAIQGEFNIKFSVQEFLNLKEFCLIQDIVKKKMSC